MKFSAFMTAVNCRAPKDETGHAGASGVQVEDDEGNAPQRKQRKIREDLIKKAKEEPTTKESE